MLSCASVAAVFCGIILGVVITVGVGGVASTRIGDFADTGFPGGATVKGRVMR